MIILRAGLLKEEIMGKYFHMTRIYLVLVTVFILTRFLLELVGPEYIAYRGFELEWESLTSEISVTRLFLVLPVFLGLRFVRETLGGLKEMFIANFMYVFWGGIMLILLHGVDDLLVLGTHYGRGSFIGTTIGQFISLVGWQLHGGPPVSIASPPGFCSSIIIMAILTNVFMDDSDAPVS